MNCKNCGISGPIFPVCAKSVGRGYEAGAGMVSDEIDALMRDVEALSGDDAAFSMLRHPSVSGGDEWWNW